MRIVKDIQSAFFDRGEHQYKPELILNPPYHCVLEYQHIKNHLPKNGHVADYGAGSGRMTIPLLQDGYKVTAVDISQQSLENLKRAAKRLNLERPSTTHKLPETETFDAVIGADVLHHVEIDRELPNLYKSLKKGGTIVFSEPSAYNVCWYLFLPLVSKWSVEKGILQCRYGNLIKLGKKHGFHNVSVEGMGLLPRPVFGWSPALARLNDRAGDLPLIKLAAYRYLLVAEK